MSILVDTSRRSEETEIMDDFSLEGKVFRDTLDKLETINRTLGGNIVTINGLKSLLKNQSKDEEFVIADLGCGHGDILRDVAKFGRKKGYKFKLIGIDANQDAIDYAEELSQDYPELDYQTLDIFSEEFKKQQYDVVLCTLFAHHFKDNELKQMLKGLLTSARLGIIINDLHRHKIAYYLFKLIGLFVSNRMVREDGLTSILRAFKKQELENISRELNAEFSIKWKWAFRYQWILFK